MSYISEPISNSSMQPWGASDHSIHQRTPLSHDPDGMPSGSDYYAPSVISSQHGSRELSDTDSAIYYLTSSSLEASSTNHYLYDTGLAFTSDSAESVQRVPPYQIELEIDEHEQNVETSTERHHNNQQILLHESQHVSTSHQHTLQASGVNSTGTRTSVPQPRGFADYSYCLASLYKLADEYRHLDSLSSSGSDDHDSEPYYTHLPPPPPQRSTPYDQSNPGPCPPHTPLSPATQRWWDHPSTAERMRLGLPRWEDDGQRLQYYRQTRAFLPQAALMSLMHDEGW